VSKHPSISISVLDGSLYNHISDVDEDSWCNDMAQPTLELALKMSDGSSTCRHHWEWKSVKAKKLNADFLPTPNLSKIDKNTDYALTMQTSTDPALEKIQERMGFKKKNGGADRINLRFLTFPRQTFSASCHFSLVSKSKEPLVKDFFLGLFCITSTTTVLPCCRI